MNLFEQLLPSLEQIILPSIITIFILTIIFIIFYLFLKPHEDLIEEYQFYKYKKQNEIKL